MVSLACLLALSACSNEANGDPSATSTPSPTTPPPALITLGVYGPTDELAAWQQVVDRYNADSDIERARLVTWPDRQAAEEAIHSATPPDIFLAARPDLEDLVDTEQIQPVGDLLDERDVDFGDGYERTALLAFSQDNALQCMPYGTSPQVIFYNTEMIDFERMAERGLLVPEFDPEKPRSWSFEQFTAAAEFAARPARRERGFYFAPTLKGLSPLLYAGGASLFDDEVPPTSTMLSAEEGVSALQTLLPVLRKTELNLSATQLEKAPPIDWFTRGKLGMIVGDHSLVPLLRRTTGLSWDVMPFPTLEESATIGDMTALCMSSGAPSADAADFMVHAISAESVATVASAGYLLPTNLEVSESDAFLDSGAPESSRVFNDSIRQMELEPVLYVSPELEAAAAPGLEGLLTDPFPDIQTLTDGIDSASQEVLVPPELPDDSASISPSPSP